MSEIKRRPFILAGEKQTCSSVRPVIQPGAGEPFTEVCVAGPAQVETAVAAAVRAFEVTRKLPTHARVGILRIVAAALETDRERIALDLAREAGKPITLAKGEVGRAALTITTAAEEASRIGGEVLNLDVVGDATGVTGITRRFPIGPVAAITPFNFPLNLVAHKLAPAVAAGCPVVLKPASATPCSALNLGTLLLEAGWPPEALSVLPCAASDAAPLVEDPRFRLVTFTGSAEVGWDIKRRAGKKRVALELGGNAVAVVDESADLEFAARRCALGGYAYAGQSCISVQRILVHWNVKKRFLQLFMDEIERLKVGDIMDPAVVVGPMITEQEAMRVESWVKEAAGHGAHILVGGKRIGALYQPTLLTRVDPKEKVSCCEVFGPVVVLDTFDSWDVALQKANDSDFGLQAGLFTADFEKIMRAFDEIEVGALVVNDMPTFRVDPQPYGGAKDSGTGREGPRYAIEEMTELRTMLIRRQP